MKQINYKNASSCYIDESVVFLGEATIGPNTTILGKCVIDDKAVIQNSLLENCEIGKNSSVIYSVVESSKIGENCKIGPFSHIRPNSIVDDGSKIGNFVELKNSYIGKGGKVSHLTYVGDATIGENANIGCGVVFVNYDGKDKHKATVGKNAFIGSNSNLIAPLKLGDDVFVAAGSTITQDLKDRQFCIARAKEYIKDDYVSPYTKKMNARPKYKFGTDGIRLSDSSGFEELGAMLARSLQKCGKAKKVALGMDTRPSGKILKQALMENFSGITIFDLGVVSTPCLAFMTKDLGCDYGIMITASHNPENYNGIKIFNCDGQKISQELEKNIENMMSNEDIFEKKVKKCQIVSASSKKYVSHIKNICPNLGGIEVAIDVAGGATERLAKKVFEGLGAKVHFVGEAKNHKINHMCGCLHLQHIVDYMKQNNVPIGFAFDGDGDRVLAVDEKLQTVDGDNFLIILAKHFLAQKKLPHSCVVCTIMSNMGTIEELKKNGIAVSQTAVGDKYVIEEMNALGSSLGAEQSGHIITKDISGSGDGLLCAALICSILKSSGKSLHALAKLKLYPQLQKSFTTNHAQEVMENKELKSLIEKIEKSFGDDGRILLRKSGTEPKVRLLVECKSSFKAKKAFFDLCEKLDSLC